MKLWRVAAYGARWGCCSILLALSLPLAAAPTLDMAFGTNGTAVHIFPDDETICRSGNNTVTSINAMRNGNILADGTFARSHTGSKCFPVYDYALAQFDRVGSLDPAFGALGIASSNQSGKLLQRDDRIVGVSQTGLIRLNSDGSPEQGFITDGAKGLDWFGFAGWKQLAQQGDGKIVVAGSSGEALALARFNADGTLDLTFNKTGGVQVPLGQIVTEYLPGLAIQTDGKIVLSSTVLFQGIADSQFIGVSVVRYNSDGTPDTSFANGGRATATASDALGPYGNYVANGVVIQPHGRIVTYGLENRFTTVQTDSKGLLLGFTPAGAGDATFGVGGAVRIDLGGMSSAGSGLVQPDGKLLVGIYDGSAGVDRILRFNVNGATDATFGDAGILSPQSFPFTKSIALQPDGNLLFGGSATDVAGSRYFYDFAVQRYISGPMAAIEHYSASRNHYFMSMNPQEVRDLDFGVHPGWARTGLSFLTYGSAASATGTLANPVCRFYIPPQHGDSHFFSADPVECAIVRDKINTDPNFSGYVEETPNAFYIDLPDKTSGECPANTTPVYRLWNQALASNHRYTTSVDVKNQMIAHGWVAEGYGPSAVDMCAPQ